MTIYHNDGKEDVHEMRRGRRRHNEDRRPIRKADVPGTNTSNPYPMRNLIPTGTDLGALGEMVVDH